MSEKKKILKRSNGHMTVARGMGGECACCVANGHMTVGRWGKGGRGSGRGGEEGARWGPGGGPVGPDRGPSSPPSIKPVGWPRALKKIDIRPGPNRAAGLTCSGWPARPGPLEMPSINLIHKMRQSKEHKQGLPKRISVS